jgi:multiple sugar transport system permease protein
MTSRRRETLLLQIIAITIVVFVLAPLFLMFATSFKADKQQVLRDLGNAHAFWVWPSEMSLDNFRDVLNSTTFPVLKQMRNSAIVVASIVGIGIFVNSLAAFALARMDFKGRNLLVLFIITLIIVPAESMAIPLLLMVTRLGWVDTLHAQIIPFIAHPFSIFLFYQFFAAIPKDLDEAAYVDGASRWRIYWSVIMPLSLPTIATVAILQSLEYWNAFLWPLMVVRSTEVRPVSLALAQFFGQPPPDWGQVMAFSVLMSLPILIIYLAFQRWFIQSAIGSGIKG